MLSKNITALSVSILLAAQAAAAPAIPSNSPLNDLLFACDRALNACQASLEAKDKVIGAQDEQLKGLASENAALRSKGDKMWNSPLFHFVLGMLVTGVTFHLVKPTN